MSLISCAIKDEERKMGIHRKFKPCCDSQTTLTLEFMKRELCAIGITLLGGPTQAAFLIQDCTSLPELPSLSPKGRERRGRVMLSSNTRGHQRGKGRVLNDGSKACSKHILRPWMNLDFSILLSPTSWHFMAQWKWIWGFPQNPIYALAGK